MSQFALYRDPVLLEPVKHRHLKMAKLTDHGMAAAMHASFLAVAEFTSAAREFVIVFVRDTIEGKLQAEPIVLPDAQVLEMHRNGMLGLVHAHLLSPANMQTLVERKGKRLQQGQQPAAQA